MKLLRKKKGQAPKKERLRFKRRTRIVLNILFWLGAFTPVFALMYMFMRVPGDELPSVEMLENPPELLASVVYADDGETELGRYWSVNRSSCSYRDISPFIFDALIATEDERFMEHPGIDMKAVARALKGMGADGGASTISQQLAKLLFTLQERERNKELRAQGKPVPERRGGIMGRVDEKVKENIIAVRLESRYTKEEIITMYLNQFDFLHNAVGIQNAAKVYFNKAPADLTQLEAATLIGMCKNPSLFDPYGYHVKNYRAIIASNKGIDPAAVTVAEIRERRAKDSTNAIDRRNTVLLQWLKNSKSKNTALKNTITQEDYDTWKDQPIEVDYQVVDHKQGVAPYFRESLRSELKAMFAEKENGKPKYAKKDGSAYDIYADGLKIYTTINVRMQDYAEQAVRRHLSEDLQPEFTKNNARYSNENRYPFSTTYNGRRVSDETINNIMKRARKNSGRWYQMKEAGYSEGEILKSFDQPTHMRVFSYNGDFDTIMTPNDSIRFYKNLIRAGMISIEPSTGFVKAWVGGPDFNHFSFDMVKQGKRQIGSTMKPFVYASALSMEVLKPCTRLREMSYCVDPCDPSGKRWCPAGTVMHNATVASCLAASNNPGTVAVMSKMGGCAGPQTVAKILERMDMKVSADQIVPPICLGTPDFSLFQLVGAQSMFVNNGIYIRPVTILRIEDRNGNVIYEADPYAREVMSATVAYETLKMMKGVITNGTSTSLRWHQKWGGLKDYPMAGKTGTTQGNSDGWFVGLTPDLVTAVWAGGEDKYVRFRSMAWGQGARMALPIFGYYMQHLYKDNKLKISKGDFEEPIGYDPELFSCDGDENRIDNGEPFGGI